MVTGLFTSLRFVLLVVYIHFKLVIGNEDPVCAGCGKILVPLEEDTEDVNKIPITVLGKENMIETLKVGHLECFFPENGNQIVIACNLYTAEATEDRLSKELNDLIRRGFRNAAVNFINRLCTHSAHSRIRIYAVLVINCFLEKEKKKVLETLEWLVGKKTDKTKLHKYAGEIVEERIKIEKWPDNASEACFNHYFNILSVGRCMIWPNPLFATPSFFLYSCLLRKPHTSFLYLNAKKIIDAFIAYPENTMAKGHLIELLYPYSDKQDLSFLKEGLVNLQEPLHREYLWRLNSLLYKPHSVIDYTIAKTLPTRIADIVMIGILKHRLKAWEENPIEFIDVHLEPFMEYFIDLKYRMDFMHTYVSIVRMLGEWYSKIKHIENFPHAKIYTIVFNVLANMKKRVINFAVVNKDFLDLYTQIASYATTNFPFLIFHKLMDPLGKEIRLSDLELSSFTSSYIYNILLQPIHHGDQILAANGWMGENNTTFVDLFKDCLVAGKVREEHIHLIKLYIDKKNLRDTMADTLKKLSPDDMKCISEDLLKKLRNEFLTPESSQDVVMAGDDEMSGITFALPSTSKRSRERPLKTQEVRKLRKVG